MKNTSIIGVLLYFIIGLFSIVSWVVNLIKFVSCDFEASYREEIIHGLGIIIAPVSMITAWI